MNFLPLENASKSYGDKVLFSDISLFITKGDKMALVAKNGSGKSTLLRVLIGEDRPEGEQAKYHINKNIKSAFLAQDPVLSGELTVLEEVFSSDNPKIQAIKAYEEALFNKDEVKIQELIGQIEDLKAWDIEANVKEVLSKLEINEFDKQIKHLSGGQVKRVALAKILIEEPDFLILDEPTNHLDLTMIEWLEQYLQRSNLSLLMVTHDRYFLERVCNVIIELDDANLYKYQGNYTDFLEKKSERAMNEQIRLDKSKKLFKKELDWIRRQPKARTTKSKSRVDKFDNIKAAAKITIADEKIDFLIKAPRLGSKILETHALTKSFDDKKIIHEFYYKFKTRETIGIVGPNGIGKSSFIKLLTKELKPDHGKVVIGDTVVFGHYAQDGYTGKDLKLIEIVREIAEYLPLEKGMKITAEKLMEKFLFPRWQQDLYFSQLSGGEKRRLYLLTVLMTNPNFLILDEPTNDLDIVTLNVLEHYLQSYNGCVIIISHDRYFMDKLVDHVFVFQGDGIIKDFPGNYSQYRIWERNERYSKESVPQEKAIVKDKPTTTKVKLSYLEKKRLEEIEKLLEKIEKRRDEIAKFFLGANEDADKIKQLSMELGEIQKQQNSLEEEWLEIQEKLENN